MRSAVLLLAFFGQFSSRPPDVPLPDPTPDFPLHVHLIATRYGTDTIRAYRTVQGELHGGPGYLRPTGSYHGYGSGNLLSEPLRGFDYTFDCPAPFTENTQPQDFYQARWKKQDQSLEILMQPVGSDHDEVCELKVAMKAHPFNPAQAPTIWSNVPLSSSDQWENPDVAFTDPDPDYPVHLHVISSFRRFSRTGFEGYGSANLVGDVPQGLDFTYSCGRGFLFNTQQDEYFQGYWVKPNQRLEILLQRTGSDKVDRCDINVTLKNAPYQNTATATQPQSAPTRPAFTKP